MGLLLSALVLVVGVAAIAVLLVGLRIALRIIINSIVGFAALVLTKLLLLPSLKITFLNTLITAVFGVMGFLFVIAAHLLGIAF